MFHSDLIYECHFSRPLLENTLILEFSMPEGFYKWKYRQTVLHACNFFAVYSSSFNPDLRQMLFWSSRLILTVLLRISVGFWPRQYLDKVYYDKWRKGSKRKEKHEMSGKGWVASPKRKNFREVPNGLWPSPPPPSFSENHVAFFFHLMLKKPCL